MFSSLIINLTLEILFQYYWTDLRVKLKHTNAHQQAEEHMINPWTGQSSSNLKREEILLKCATENGPVCHWPPHHTWHSLFPSSSSLPGLIGDPERGSWAERPATLRCPHSSRAGSLPPSPGWGGAHDRCHQPGPGEYWKASAFQQTSSSNSVLCLNFNWLWISLGRRYGGKVYMSTIYHSMKN